MSDREAAVLTAARAREELTTPGQTHMVVVLDEELLERPETLAGLDENGVLLVATRRTPQHLRQGLRQPVGTVATIDNTELAVRHGSDWAAPVLGAIARVTGFVDPDCLCPAVWTAYDREFPYLAAASVRACDDGYRSVLLAH